ncbi:MAG: TIGR03016 family PEP-CTERM system-associated outer membrane protein, partial [Burkholderiaceae bacterium]
RVRGFLGYSLNALSYARESGSNSIQHALNAAATIEAVEDWAFVDVAGSISQQAISVFGLQSRDNAVTNDNRTAVTTYSLSPYVRGRIADVANYEARLTYIGSSSDSSAVSNAATSEALFRIGGATAFRALGWSVDASRQTFQYDTTGTVHSDRVRGVLSYAVTPELRLTLIGGRESENYAGSGNISHNTTGWGFDWTPTERTRISAIREQRFFGNSHAFTLEHRTPRTVWKFTDSRDLASGFNQLRLGSLGTAYDLFYTQFASIEPDPVARAVLVNAFLQSNGIAPNTVVLGGSLASATLVQRRQELSFGWSGLRDTLTISIAQSEGDRAEQVVIVNDDFANGNRVRQRGVSVSLAHRLTPVSALNVTATVQTSSGTVDARSSRLRTLTIGWSGEVSARTRLSLSGRHSRSDGSPDNRYDESALIGTLDMRF